MPTNEKSASLKNWAGHVITILMAAAMLAFSYGAIDSRVNELEKRMDSVDKNLMPLMHELREDINDVKVKMAEIGADVRWLKTGKDKDK